MMIDIAVIGRGSAGCIAIMELVRNKNINVTCFYDPEIPYVNVGESATHKIKSLLVEVCDYLYLRDNHELGLKHRYGTRYTSKNDDMDFYVEYPDNANIHIDSRKFSEFVLKRCTQLHENFIVIDKKVNKIKHRKNGVIVFTNNEKYEFDYVIDCGGLNVNDESFRNDYTKPEIETVNSVAVFDGLATGQEYTTSDLHDNGWTFGVSLDDRQTYGYLYNNNYSSREDAIINLKLMGNNDHKNIRFFSWNFYYRKNIIEDRVIYLGNKLYFFEPHMALPLHLYACIMEQFHMMLYDDFCYNVISFRLQEYYTHAIECLINLICLNYVGTFGYKSYFWKYVSVECKNHLKKSKQFSDWAKKCLSDDMIHNYYFMNDRIMKQYIEGYKIDLKEFV